MKENKTSRVLKVYKRFQNRSWHNKTVPEITLKGEWLRASGFEIGDHIKIDVKDGELNIQTLSISLSHHKT